MNIPNKKQSGVGLLEVLIAIFILAFGSIAIVNLQTSSVLAITISADHFKINELSQEIAEQLKADSKSAAAGEYNTGFAETAAATGTPLLIAQKINQWKTSMARSTTNGETSIACNLTECNIGLKWYEISHDDVSNQVFNLKTPI